MSGEVGKHRWEGRRKKLIFSIAFIFLFVGIIPSLSATETGLKS